MKLLLALVLLFALSSARITIPLEAVHIDPTSPQNEFESNAVSVRNTFLTKNSDSMNITWWNQRNRFYFGNIYVGSNNQTMKVLFDTGSNELWLSTPSCSVCPGKNRFDCSQSTTCKRTAKTNTLTYGLGQVNGVYGSDMIGVTPTFRVESPILMINSGSQLAAYNLVDGFLGIGSKNDAKDFIDLAYDAGQIDSKIFSIYMDTNLDASGGLTNGTYMTIGYVPEEKINNMVWIPVTVGDRWATDILGMKVGDNVLSSVDTTGTILFDTGCSFMYLSSALVNEWTSQMSKYDRRYVMIDIFNGIYFYPCEESDLTKYPTIYISVSGLRIEIKPSTYFDFAGKQKYNGHDYCMPAFQVSTFGMSILGDSWLKDNYMAYSKLNQTLGVDLTAGHVVLPNPNPPIYVILIQVILMVAIALVVIQNQKKKMLENNKSSVVSNETLATQPLNSNQVF